MAISRSSASSSSIARSALRVTRKRWRLDDLHAGEQVGEVGLDDLVDRARSATGSTSSRRGRICGTLTRANTRSPVSGSRRPTAIDRLSVEMYGNGCPGSTASGVRTGKISSRKRWRSASWCSGMAA